MALPETDEFHIEYLSDRERAVFDLAVEGHTDELIAQSLGVATSTVASYWVRIRGKLGSLSRTEMVGAALRREIRERTAELRAENARLRAELARQADRTQGLLATQAALAESAWQPHALARLPEAVLVVGPPADVVYANLRALRLYRADEAGLEGLAMRDLTTAGAPGRLREPCREMLLPGGPEEETYGLEEPYYARRRDGTNFQALVEAERFDTPSGPFVALAVREFMQDVEPVLAALCRPLKAA